MSSAGHIGGPQAPPTAPGNRLLGNVRELGRDPLTFLANTARDYGDVVRYRLLNYDFYLVTHPEGVQRILVDNNKNYTREGSRIWDAVKPAFGNPLIASDGESWFFRRRVMQPVFIHKHVANFAQIIIDRAATMLDEWDAAASSDRPVNLVPLVNRMTLDILMRSLFGVDDAQMTDDLGRATLTQSEDAIMRARLLFYPPLSVPTPHNRRVRAANRLLDKYIYALIASRRAAPDAYSDLLALLMKARDEETGEGLSDRQLRDEIASLHFAGYSSASNALLWAFYHLALSPDPADRLRSDVDRVLGGRTPTTADLPNLPYVQQVFFETVRLHPPGWVSVRRVIADDEISGFRIPAGSHVTVSEHVTHRSPKLWDDPERFDPDRMESELVKARPRYAFFPFLGGPHQCLGRDFVLLLAPLVLIMAAQRFRLDVQPGHVAEAEPLITQRMRGALPMIIRRNR